MCYLPMNLIHDSFKHKKAHHSQLGKELILNGRQFATRSLSQKHIIYSYFFNRKVLTITQFNRKNNKVILRELLAE